jgi:hypothetical protein
MIKSVKRRKNIGKRIAASKARTDARVEKSESFDLRASLRAIKMQPEKQYPWERKFSSQDAAGTRTQGGRPEHWEFINGEDHFVQPSKASKLRKPITAGA